VTLARILAIGDYPLTRTTMLSRVYLLVLIDEQYRIKLHMENNLEYLKHV
jgi:hypothetical protein